MTGHDLLRDLFERDSGLFGQRIGFGRRPAVLSVDMQQAYLDRTSPLFLTTGAAAAKVAGRVIGTARAASIPVVHTRIRVDRTGRDGGIFLKKNPYLGNMVADAPIARIVPDTAPLDDELVIDKVSPSAFFGTPLLSVLVSAGIDTVVLTGFSTSGCVRATAVDAMQHGFRTIVVREAVADRHPVINEVSLFDIHSKYGDVLDADAVCRHLDSVEP